MNYLKNVSTLKFYEERCVKCKKCLEVCPHAVFMLFEGEIKITDKDKCMECGACKKNCKYGAVEVDSGVGCAEALIYGILTGKEPECGCCNSEKE